MITNIEEKGDLKIESLYKLLFLSFTLNEKLLYVYNSVQLIAKLYQIIYYIQKWILQQRKTSLETSVA